MKILIHGNHFSDRETGAEPPKYKPGVLRGDHDIRRLWLLQFSYQ